jgi:ubiquinone biosynthesis protein
MVLLRLFKILFILVRRKGLFLLIDLKFVPSLLLPFFRYNNSVSKGKTIRAILEDLGPFFVKFGQTLATRSDIVGDEVSFELSLLQDRITPKMDKKEAQTIIRQSLGKDINELFKEFSQMAIAAASISEVFLAKTLAGEKVAVKILKPGIEKTLDKDIKFFIFLAKIIDNNFASLQRLKLIEVVNLFQIMIKKEMDLTLEAAAASQLRENHSNDKGVYVPKIHWEMTSKNILTLEWLEGIPIYKISELKKHKIDINKVVRNFAFMFFNQAYRDGFFHADLHPGNLLVKKNGDIELIDFGIIGTLDRKTKVYLAEILKGFLNKDYYHVAKIHFAAGYVSEEYSMEEFALGCRAIGEPIVGITSDQISVGTLLARLFKLTKDFNMSVQPQLLLIQKTTVVVEGVISSLDPKTNMWDLARPWIDKWSDKAFDASIINAAYDMISFIKKDFVSFFKKNYENSNKQSIRKNKRKNFIIQLLVVLLSTLSAVMIFEKFI